MDFMYIIIYFAVTAWPQAHGAPAGNRTTTTSTPVPATTATTATTLKAFCAEHVFLHGNISYTEPVDSSFGPRQEGSQAVFECNPGYLLSNNTRVTCKEGQWTGAMPSCVLDRCADVDCGGPSKCTNGVGQYTCECAPGWHGGGVNKKCEKGHCKCTGNKGFWQAPTMRVNGETKLGYNYGESFGNGCAAFDKHKFDKNHPNAHEHQWMLEPWCYVPCDRSSCNVDLPRTETFFLWRAKVEGEELCYSYENCGGVDYFTDGPAADCVTRGGYFVDGHCTCDFEPNDCTPDMDTVGGVIAGSAAVVIAIVVLAIVCFCNKEAKTEIKETAHDPWHLAEYGLATLVKEDDLRPDNHLKKGFESSNFRVVKDALTKRVQYLSGVMPARYITDAIRGLVTHHTGTSSRSPRTSAKIEALMTQTEIVMAQNRETAEDAGVKAEMFWSSEKKFMGIELCSILNAAIRNDHPDNIVHAVVFAKGIEMRRNMDRVNLSDLSQKYPDVHATADMFPGGEFPESLEHQDWRVCWRGGGFNNDFQDFFAVGKYYRCPGFLATSFDKSISVNFLTMKAAEGTPTALWMVLLDALGTQAAEYRCMHASYVLKSHLGNEKEFLFSPHSVFQVVTTQWSCTNGRHTIVLRAAIDNRNHPEDLPLAPWY